MSNPRGSDSTSTFARGAALVIAARWTDRLIGIASTLILARLLVPADFGVVAMASLVVALVDTLLDLGVNAALVQNRDASREDFDTAWTLRLAQSTLAATLIALIGAPVAAEYFGDPRVSSVLWLMALTLLVAGLENIGIVNFQKRMDFGSEFRFNFRRRLAGFVVTIALAFWLRSYWAMVIGALAGRAVGVWLSYRMHEFRPRLSMSRMHALWGFSQWMLVRNLGIYGIQQIDKFAVGRRAGANVLGVYSLADEIAAIPTTELLAPIGRVLFPAFVDASQDANRLRHAFNLAFGMQAMLALPAGVGLAMVANSAVPLLLGPRWSDAVPLLQTLAVINVAMALTHACGYLLLALGHVRALAWLSWLQLAMLAVAIILAFPTAGAPDIARIRLVIAMGVVLLFLGVTIRLVPGLRWRDFLASGWRPLTATASMSAVLSMLPPFDGLTLATRLAVEVSLGGTAYIATILALWRLGGCPDGAERYMLEYLAPSVDPNVEVRSHARIDELPEGARVLLTDGGAGHPEASPWWFRNLQRTVFADGNVRYLTAWREGACQVVLPVRIVRDGAHTRVESLSNFYTSLYLPALASSATVSDVRAILRYLSRLPSRPAELRFAPMDPDSNMYRLLASALRANRWHPFAFFCFGNWYLEVTSDWKGFLANRPGEVRGTLRRMEKKFTAAGGRIQIIDSAERLETAIAAYGEVYAASWKVPEPFPEFMPGLIRALAEHGALRLGIAWLDESPIAVQVWAVKEGRAQIIKLAHRQDRAEFSAGSLLTARLMAHVIDRDRVREVDYLIGDDPYKRNWMSHRRERWGLVAYNPGLIIGLMLFGREFVWRMLKHARHGFRAASPDSGRDTQ